MKTIAMNTLGSFLLVLCACAVHGFQWGPESKACDVMMPVFNKSAKAMKDDMYYRISANKNTYYPGEKLYIRIKGKTSDDRYTYQGALLTVKVTKAIGTWEEFHVDKYKRIACDGVMNTGIVESNEREKIVGDDVFIWTAPDKCEDTRFVVLTGTVIKHDMEYSPAVSALLACIEKRVLPPEPEVKDACMENYHSLPNNGTGFETNYGGWWNDPMSALRWTRHTGQTPSFLTGPGSAVEGRWYIYSEASKPATEGDQAILNSPIGLAGCMCVRFQYHIFGGPGLELKFMVNGNLVFSHGDSLNRWSQEYATVNVPGDVKIQIIMTRGKEFRGDVGLDDITIVPGICAEDKMRMQLNE